ncbi:hypothetical protein WMY93_021681 [Mugilogobius chulae]|uniref:L1 transposable element RRM domain-containing protein n=1 Tax=Mugilogobius chulae TaxID=88201 RepID=A0AAW0NH55_9GOBI
MSLDNFFTMSKRRELRKRGKNNANDGLANQDGEADQELERIANEDEDRNPGMLPEIDDTDLTRDDILVQRVTHNVEKMLDSKFAEILKPVNEVSGKLDRLGDRIEAVEQRVSDLEDTAEATAPRLDSLESTLKKAVERLENYENQIRQQNIKIIGLKEGAEGSNPRMFFENWIPEVLNMDMQGRRLEIERVHRLGPPLESRSRRAPRPVLVKLRDFTDKERILRTARIKGDGIKVDDQAVSFYQDFSADVIKRRQESATERKRLREAGIKYAFLYPAVIKIFPQTKCL